MSEVMKRYEVVMLPCAEIYCDNDFNCRGTIDRATLIDLATDIKERGLDFPIHVHRYDLKSPFKYRIISGHCRFTAVFHLNKTLEIPAVIRDDLKGEIEFREANLRENVQRRDLTLLQEAEAIAFFIQAGYSEAQIGQRLGKSPGWVTPRRLLMGLPEFVRKAANEGVVTQNHVKQMWNYRNDSEKLAEMIRTIKERAEKGERAIVLKEDVKITEFASVRRPKPHEIEEFTMIFAKCITNKLPEDDTPIAHKILSWTMGHTSMAAIYVALKKECERLGLPFIPPSDVEKIMREVGAKI